MKALLPALKNADLASILLLIAFCAAAGTFINTPQPDNESQALIMLFSWVSTIGLLVLLPFSSLGGWLKSHKSQQLVAFGYLVTACLIVLSLLLAWSYFAQLVSGLLRNPSLDQLYGLLWLLTTVIGVSLCCSSFILSVGYSILALPGMSACRLSSHLHPKDSPPIKRIWTALKWWLLTLIELIITWPIWTHGY